MYKGSRSDDSRITMSAPKTQVEQGLLKTPYATPSIYFSTKQEWIEARNKMYESIRNGISDLVTGAAQSEYALHSYGIFQHIKNALLELTNNVAWSKAVSWDISNGIEAFLQAIFETMEGQEFYERLEPAQTVEIIYNTIKIRLGDDDSTFAILDSVPLFECKKCGKRQAIIGDDNMCVEKCKKIRF